MSDGDKLLLDIIKLTFAVLGISIVSIAIYASGILDTEEDRYEHRIHMEALRKLGEVARIESQTRFNNMVQQLKMEKPFKSDNVKTDKAFALSNLKTAHPGASLPNELLQCSVDQKST